jgi:hypothetical protein
LKIFTIQFDCATYKDFFASFEVAELESVFLQWVTCPGHPILDVTWHDESKRQLKIVQSHSKSEKHELQFPISTFPFQFRLDFQVENEMCSTIIKDFENIVSFKAPSSWVKVNRLQQAFVR